jgi:hypothetical protein
MQRFKSVRLWVKGLVAAAVGGAANSIVNIGIAPETFNFQDGLGRLAAAAGASAILSMALYLKQSPVPSETDDLERLRNNGALTEK